jgi:hypothetical protein
MAEVAGHVLAFAARAIAAEMRRLRATPDDRLEDAILLDDYATALDAIEDAYDVAARKQINLLPFDELIAPDPR